MNRETNQNLDDFRVEIKIEMQEFKTEMKTEMKNLKTETGDKIENLKFEMNDKFDLVFSRLDYIESELGEIGKIKKELENFETKKADSLWVRIIEEKVFNLEKKWEKFAAEANSIITRG